jgi:F5/8 type C domain
MTQEKPADSGILSEWLPTVSGNAELKLSAASVGDVPALRMDFDFRGGGGFVVVRRVLNRPMPNEYAVHFRLRGRGATNNLELKLIDTSGQNVWRHVQKDLKPPVRWKRMTVDSRDIDFAWGPSSGRGIAQLGFIEFAIVAGEGGQGTMWLADVQIEDRTPTEAPTAIASSELPNFEASKALAGAGSGVVSASPAGPSPVGRGWKPRPDDLRPWLVVDSIQPRAFGGLTIDWLGDAPARGFRIRGSNNGHRWKTLHSASRAGGKRTNVYLPGLKNRFIRLELDEPSAGAVLRLQSFEFSRSIDAFWHHIAEPEARGWHPRWLHREQTMWTPIGTSNGTQCALMNDDGMVEVAQGSFSIEPMLWIGERLVTWADVIPRQELREAWMPVPSAIWETGDWRLSIQAEATVSGVLRVRYRFENLTDQAFPVRLFVLVRPFQVTPPWQSFRGLGGVSPIHDLRWRDGAVHVNESVLVVPMTEPEGFGALCFDDGFIGSPLSAGQLPRITEAHDAFGFATGALRFELSPQSYEMCERAVSCVAAVAAGSLDEPAFDWGARLAVARWTGNGWITDAIQAALTATAHILVTRSGPALQPGPRRYTRSWIRDGAMMSAALLRMGHLQEVKEFIRWYAPHQRADGFVPCCVDHEGVDWLVEHDSHGQLIALIADYCRFASDDPFLEECWAFVDKAVGFIERILDQTGLLPISVSHEGYLAQPVHSYWDDFWALRGLRDAVYLARTLGKETTAQRWEALTARFGSTLFTSIETTRAQRKLGFIPGSIEWADFDPTATANAVYLLDVPAGLDRHALEQTFDTYLADWRNKRSGRVASTNYTPYEIRIIGAFVRLGRRDAALELLRFFLSDRRPPPWNQWPEIAWRDHQSPAHVGDLPHTWIAAEYVLAVRSLFAYECEAEQSLVLAAGLAGEWIEGSGVQVDNMPTLYGSLKFSLRRVDAQTLRFEVGSGIASKITLRPPLDAPLRSVLVNGIACTSFSEDSVTIFGGPAEVTCTMFPRAAAERSAQ